MRTVFATLILAAGFTLAGFHAAPAPTATATASKASTLALQLTNDLAQGKDPAVYAHFGTQMKSEVSPAALGGLWKQFEAKFGAFQSASGAGEKQVQGYDQELVQCKFARKTVDLLWSLDAKDLSVAGLHVQSVH